MAIPIYGGESIGKMLTPVYIKLHNKADLNGTTGLYDNIFKANSLASLNTLIEGTKATTTYEMVVNQENVYFTFHTPHQSFAIGNGTFTAAETSVKVTYTKAGTIADSIANIGNAMKQYDKFVEFENLGDGEFKLTANHNGVCAGGDVGTFVVTDEMIVTPTVGAGDFAKIGKLKEDMSVEKDEEKINDSEGGEITISTTYSPEFELMNVNQHNWEAIQKNYQGKDVDLVFYDSQDYRHQFFAIRNIPCNATLNILGADISGINFSMSKKYSTKQAGGALIYKTFEHLED